MRKRTIKKQIWINQNEDNLLKYKSKKSGLNESEFLRSCIKGYKVKEQPTKEIRDFLKQISGIANNVNQIKDYKVNFENQLPKLKGKREDLWRKYHKTTNENDKITIKNEINKLTEEIDTITAQKNACNRIIDRYNVVREKCLKKFENKEKSNNLIENNKIKIR